MMSRAVRASVLHGAKDLRMEERQISAPAADEVQVSIRSTGICGSDLHYYHHYANGDIQIREPLSLGHESAGVIEAVGESVMNFRVGDRVALEVGVPCELCDRCREGKYNLCKDMKFRGSAKLFPHFQGTLQERINHPAKWCYTLPENVTLQEGALLEPMSVAIHAVRRADLRAGGTVLVLGAGAVGMLTAAVLMVMGARTIVIADIDERRVDFAVREGFADRGAVIPRKKGETTDGKLKIAKDNAAAIGKTDDVSGKEIGEFDAVFECTGVEVCVQTAIYATRAAGKVLMVGMGSAIQTLPISAAALREVDLLGVFRYASTYGFGLSMLANKDQRNSQENTGRPLPDISKLATHHFQGFENIGRAFSVAAKGMDDDGKLAMKIMIDTSV